MPITKNNWVVFEDESFLVLNKPAGIIVNLSQTTAGKLTVEDWLNDYGIKDIDRHGIVHRLDKDTSGLLVVGKSTEAMLTLQSQFKNRQVKKSYLALIHGQLNQKEGTVNAPISRNPFNRQRFGIFVGGREARTDYQLLEGYKSPDGEVLSLVKALPLTGRTHQIRVHFKYLNHPLVADPWYGGRKTFKKDLAWCPRLFLHAASISFNHPVTGKPLNYEINLPEDLQSVLNKLKKTDE